jgi:hypothetical protein
VPHPPGLVMWPGVLKRALVVVVCGALTVALAACESTENESATIEREASKSREAEPGALKLGAANKTVRVSDATLISSGGQKAVAVKLTSTAAHDQRQLPVLVEVTAAAGKIAYTNQIGVEPALQHISQLRAHSSAWWVDDQVLANQTTRAVRVRVGSGKTQSHDSLPLLTAKLANAAPGQSGSVSGVLVNHSRVAQKKVPVYVVALRGGKVVAAGRALVASLAGRPGASAPFKVTLVGSPAGAKIELTAVATAS